MTKERKVFDKKKKKRSIGKRGVVDKWLIDMKKCDCVLGCSNHVAIIRENLGEHDHTTRFLCVQCNMRYWRGLDLRTSMSTRFNLKYLCVFSKKKTPRKVSFYSFSPKTSVRLFILKEVKPSPDSKMIKLLNFDNLFPPQTVEWHRLSRFPAKMTLVHAWALLRRNLVHS